MKLILYFFTNCNVLLRLPIMPHDITSSVLAFETIVGKNSAHLFYKIMRTDQNFHYQVIQKLNIESVSEKID